MKKILSLMTAMLLMMSVSAAPVQVRQSKVPAKAQMGQSMPKKAIKKASAASMETIALTGMDAMEFAFYQSYSEEGAWNYSVNCYNKTDSFPYLMLDVYASVKGQLEGSYSMSAGNVGEYSMVYLTNSTGAEFVDANFTISKSGDNYIVAGQAKDSANNVYTFSVTAPATFSDGDYPYEPMEVQATKILTIANLEIDKDYLSDYGEAYYDFTTSDGIVVELNWYTEGSTIPGDGTYQIDTTAEVFYAGYYSYFGPSGSYYYDEDGGELYYLVSGTVKIETKNNATTYTVDATSAHGTKIQFSYTTKGGVTPTPVDGATIVVADYATTSFTTTDGVFTVAAAKAGAANDPVYNSNESDLRIYAKGTLTVSSTGTMRTMVFTLSSKGKMRQAEITPSTGAMSYDVDGAGTVTWSGEATSVTFTVGETAVYGSDGSGKAGQFDFTAITISAEGGDVPPTPTGFITVAEALEIGNALADGATTTESYTVAGWAIKLYGTYNTQYKSQSWYMSDDKTETYGEFEAFQCYPDKEVAVGDYMMVSGQITKYVSSKGVTTIEIKNGKAEHAQYTSIDETETTVKPVKFMKNGQLYIQRGDEVFSVMGNMVK